MATLSVRLIWLGESFLQETLKFLFLSSPLQSQKHSFIQSNHMEVYCIHLVKKQNKEISEWTT